ncbi:glycine zipper 2TM domain-containing protein [Phenylobacterium sp. J426]|uniref:glycine zipper 2TM domain-containing protein n=1 Tax=Phenylobacterium sp. J426 TaxID=2898439 RepID=UPI0021514E18|nr:glycine zipper 2TM domain-containing protein [Phenylobacterium sp. J426]MCR5875532.1 glycine zipper 2TM domain-containing protein [Phenylobacterium sp. J426]
MRKSLIAGGVAALALIPSLAHAQQTCEERRNNRIAGTVVGGALGAIAGSAVAGRGDRNEGAVIGGLAGAVIGNQVSKGNGDCRRAYGWYDNNGVWHSNAVERSYAQGYYDRNGNWIEGRPPAGDWDRSGRWAMSANSYGANANSYGPPGYTYRYRSEWRDAPEDIRARTDWLENRIVRSRNSGAISRRESQQAMNTLQDIRRQERTYWRDGRLDPREADTLMARLDDLNAKIRYDRRD